MQKFPVRKYALTPSFHRYRILLSVDRRLIGYLVGSVQLGYSNYAMKALDIFEALPRLKEIGYEAMEIAIRTGWQTSAEKLDSRSRRGLVEVLQSCGFPPPPLMGELATCVQDERWEETVSRFESSCILARDLNFGDRPAVVTSTLGGCPSPWEGVRDEVKESLLRLADVAEKYRVILALEPHYGNELDTPEKSVWMMEATQHECLKLNFDISHFTPQGFDLNHCVGLCAPYAVHTHIKDGVVENGKIRYLLPGEGELDLTEYMAAVSAAGIGVPITVEVSGMIWSWPDYDPWKTAEDCYRALDDARREAGV